MNLFGFFPGYEARVYDAGREPAFLMLVSFILTLAGTRFYTRMARTRGWGSAHLGDVHVHHLVPGIVLSLVAGGLAIGLEPPEFGVAVLAIVFGAGAALVLDEFAMLLHLDDVYWTRYASLSRPPSGRGGCISRVVGGGGGVKPASPLARRAGPTVGTASTI
jgi:hypothetical protein